MQKKRSNHLKVDSKISKENVMEGDWRRFPFTTHLTQTFSGLRFFHAAFIASRNPGLHFLFFGRTFLAETERVCVPSAFSRSAWLWCQPSSAHMSSPSLPGNYSSVPAEPHWLLGETLPFDVLKKDLQCSLSSLLFCLWFIQTFSQVRSDSVPQYQNKQRSAAINGGMRAKANIDDVLENVTAAVKISNSVIIVTIWVVNLHFFVASARSVGCNSGRCFLFYCLKLLWFTFTAQISTHSFQAQQAGVWVRKLCQTQFAPPTHYRAAEWSQRMEYSCVSRKPVDPGRGIKGSFRHVFTCVSSETITWQLMSPRCGLRCGQK